MGFEAKEQFRILFLDKRNQIIADEVQQNGTVDHTPVHEREVVKRALELSAMARAQPPSGDPTPSRADIEMTKQIVSAAKNLGIVVHATSSSASRAMRASVASARSSPGQAADADTALQALAAATCESSTMTTFGPPASRAAAHRRASMRAG